MTTNPTSQSDSVAAARTAAIEVVAQLEMEREGHPYSRSQEEFYEDAAETVDAIHAALEPVAPEGAMAIVPVIQAHRARVEDAVLIWSGEHHAYWRPNSAGYCTDGFGAGVYDRVTALQIVAGCDPEKRVSIREIDPNWPIVAHLASSPASTGDAVQRITCDQYPEIIQAARWMDDDNGTPHFEPGVGFIVDDPDGLTVPERWVEHLPMIEAALAGLDHANPHPADIDTLECLARDGKEPGLFESAARCFVTGEYTPVKIMANSSRELWIANRFFNERFEGWAFDPGAGYVTPDTSETATNPRREYLARILADAEANPSTVGAITPSETANNGEPDRSGEVERLKAVIRDEVNRLNGADTPWSVGIRNRLRAALSTHPATSQEGEAQASPGDQP
jgi:hypothetical protein